MFYHGTLTLKLLQKFAYHNVINSSKKGSIVVFHENEKSMKNIMYVLPKVLEHFTKLGYEFKAIPSY